MKHPKLNPSFGKMAEGAIDIVLASMCAAWAYASWLPDSNSADEKILQDSQEEIKNGFRKIYEGLGLGSR